MYQDFVAINNSLIDNKLRHLLLQYSNNKQDVDFIYNKAIKRRNVCCLFVFKHHRSMWNKYSEDYFSLMNQLNTNKNDKLKMFCILYNCIASIFITGDDGDNSGATGLDKYIFEYNHTSNDLSHLCMWYILIQMVKTGCFGNDEKLTEKGTYSYDKDVYSSSIVSLIIKNMFHNDLTSVEKLLQYCVQDIKCNNDIKKLKNIYKLNANADSKWDYGISFYVLNRLSYVIYHDLLCLNMNKNINEFLFPSLITFYKFLYNFAVYCHCYIHYGVYSTKQYESLVT